MDDNVLLAIAKLFRAHQEQLLKLRADLTTLRSFIGADSGPENLEALFTLAEDEHKFEQMDAEIRLLEHGKDSTTQDA